MVRPQTTGFLMTILVLMLIFIGIATFLLNDLFADSLSLVTNLFSGSGAEQVAEASPSSTPEVAGAATALEIPNFPIYVGTN